MALGFLDTRELINTKQVIYFKMMNKDEEWAKFQLIPVQVLYLNLDLPVSKWEKIHF